MASVSSNSASITVGSDIFSPSVPVNFNITYYIWFVNKKTPNPKKGGLTYRLISVSHYNTVIYLTQNDIAPPVIDAPADNTLP